MAGAVKIYLGAIEGQIGVQCTWLALACMLNMNRLHSCNITNEEGDVLLNLKQGPVRAVGLFVGVLDLDSQAKGAWPRSIHGSFGFSSAPGLGFSYCSVILGMEV